MCVLHNVKDTHEWLELPRLIRKSAIVFFFPILGILVVSDHHHGIGCIYSHIPNDISLFSTWRLIITVYKQEIVEVFITCNIRNSYSSTRCNTDSRNEPQVWDTRWIIRILESNIELIIGTHYQSKQWQNNLKTHRRIKSTYVVSKTILQKEKILIPGRGPAFLLLKYCLISVSWGFGLTRAESTDMIA